MYKCLNCYAVGCNERKQPPTRHTNFEKIAESFSTMADFLNGVITDCEACPVDKRVCKKDKRMCQSSLKSWLMALGR